MHCNYEYKEGFILFCSKFMSNDLYKLWQFCKLHSVVSSTNYYEPRSPDCIVISSNKNNFIRNTRQPCWGLWCPKVRIGWKPFSFPLLWLVYKFQLSREMRVNSCNLLGRRIRDAWANWWMSEAVSEWGLVCYRCRFCLIH